MTAVLPEHNPEQRMYPVEVAGALVGLKRSMTWEVIRLGRLKSVQEGRRRLVPVEYLDEYVELLKREADEAQSK